MPPTFLIYLCVMYVLYALPYLIGSGLVVLAFIYGRRLWRRHRLGKSGALRSENERCGVAVPYVAPALHALRGSHRPRAGPAPGDVEAGALMALPIQVERSGKRPEMT